MSIYKHDSYVAVLKDFLRRNAGQTGYQTRLAAAAGCQKSYLSLVLREKVLLTPDHAFRMARFLGLSDGEREFFLLLLHKERAGTEDYRRYLEAQLRAQRESALDVSRLAHSEQADLGEKEAAYYSSWIYGAIHMAIGVEGLQTATALAARFGLAKPVVVDVLRSLERMGLAARAGERFSRQEKSLHLPKHSPYARMVMANWRMKAMLDMQIGDRESVHYTAVHSLSRRDVERIRELIHGVVEESRKLASASEDQEVYCLACDWFRA